MLLKCSECQRGEEHICNEECSSTTPETVGQIPEKGCQREFLKRLNEEIVKRLDSAAKDRSNCFSAHEKLKEEIQYKADLLFTILRKRVADLNSEIDKQFSARLKEIDEQAVTGIGRKLDRHNAFEYDSIQTMLLFDSDFDALKQDVECFGKLMCEKYIRSSFESFPDSWTCDITSHPSDNNEISTNPFGAARIRQPISKRWENRVTVMPGKVKQGDGLDGEEKSEDEFSFNKRPPFLPLRTPVTSKEDSKGKRTKTYKFGDVIGILTVEEKSENELSFNKMKSPVAREEDSKTIFTDKLHDALAPDEGDLEIIHSDEIESIPSDVSFSPSLPPKNRLVGKTRSFFSSLRRKGDKKNCQSPKSTESESSGEGEYKESLVSSGASSFGRTGTESESSGCESESQESLVSSGVSSAARTGMKGNQSFCEQVDQGSPSASRDHQDEDLGQCCDPTVALLSSLSKYLEKTHISEWLSPV